VTPADMMAKIMKEPELAAAMQKPKVMQAIMVGSLFSPAFFFSTKFFLLDPFLCSFGLCSCALLRCDGFSLLCFLYRDKNQTKQRSGSWKKITKRKKTHPPLSFDRKKNVKKTLTKIRQEMQSDPMAFMKYTGDADVMLVLNKLQEMFGPAAAQMQAQQQGAAAGGGFGGIPPPPPPSSSS